MATRRRARRAAMVSAAIDSRALWYLTRGTGLVSLLLLTASVALGIMTSNRWSSPRWPRFVTAALHRNVSLLVVVFLAMHIVTAVADRFAPIHWINVVVPFTASYRPVWLGLGAVAFDLLVAVTVTSLLRQRIGHRIWRLVHWGAYACWPVALVHSLGTGTDVRARWSLLFQLGALAVVVLAVWWRLAAAPSTHPGRRQAGFLAAITLPVLIIAFTLAGPLQRGWAARAGTPPTLLASAAGAASAASTASGTSATTLASSRAGSGAGSAATSPPTSLNPPFSASLTGTIAQTTSADGSSATVTIAGRLTGGASGQLRLVLQGTPAAGGGISMTASAASLGSAAQPNLYRGQIVALQGNRVVADLQRNDGATLRLQVELQIDQTNQTVSGLVQGTSLPPASSGEGGD